MFHPQRPHLVAYATGELTTERRARVAQHLLGCARCRASVDGVHQLMVGAEREAPRLTSDVLSRVVMARRAGTEVILPATNGAAPRKNRRLRARALATVGLAIIGVALVSELGAERSDLSFSQSRLVPGESITVRYRSTGKFAGQPELVLRARFRSSVNDTYDGSVKTVSVAELVRGRGREYRGTFVVPDDAVYAVFAVEDTTGNLVDHRNGDPWELYRLGGDLPAREALRQRQHEYVGRDWRKVREAIMRRTTLYPNDPGGWADLLGLQMTEAPGQPFDSILETYRERVASLHSLWSADDRAPPEVIVSMFQLARLTAGSNRATVDYWRRRLYREAPGHPTAVRSRALESRRLAEPTETFADLDSIWLAAGPQRRLAELGYTSALQSRDTLHILVWADRLGDVDPRQTLGIAEQLASTPDLRRHGISRLRRQLERLDASSDAARELGQTQHAMRRQTAAARAHVLTTLARALLSDGAHDAALVALHLAAREHWSLGSFSVAAEAYYAVGDTLEALSSLANIAVDPMVPVARRDSISDLAAARMGREPWTRKLATAWRQLSASVEGKATTLPLPLRGVLRDGMDRRYEIRRLLGDSTAIIAIESSYRSAPDSLAVLYDWVDRLQARGARIVVLRDNGEPSQAERPGQFTDGSSPVSVVFDPDGHLRPALQWWTTPWFYVIRADRRTTYATGSVGDAVRAAYVWTQARAPSLQPVAPVP